MARYKAIELSPRFLAVDLEKQLLPVSFAHPVHHQFDHDFDLSSLDTHYRNNDTGASAYPPAMLLKSILSAHVENVVSIWGSHLCQALPLKGPFDTHYYCFCNEIVDGATLLVEKHCDEFENAPVHANLLRPAKHSG